MLILIVDDDQALCRSLQLLLEREGHQIETAFTGVEADNAMGALAYDMAFVDLKLPDTSGLEVLTRLRETQPECLAVMITGTQDMKATIEAVRLGAFDYIRKPLDLEAVLVTVEKAAREATRADRSNVKPIGETNQQRHEIIGCHPKIIEVLKQIGLLSQCRVPVLIHGESGTGKELVARALHGTSSPGQPFVAVNCSAVVPTLLESELFGHAKGAFTGAEKEKTGRLELAGEGTIFFDEIGDMSFDLQAKLLRALQEREFERVGSVITIPLRARVVAATHRDLQSLVAQGKFREDLYYRLAVAVIHVPPLREHREDIPLLVNTLLARLGLELHKELSGIEDNALNRLQAYDWPGNVRELENVVARAVALSREPILREQSIAISLHADTAPQAATAEVRPLRDAERDYIESALYANAWNVKRTARLLDISPTTLRKKIGDYDLRPPDKRRNSL